ncbi:MAG TPA: phosphomannomutase/phosphoglucomutase, partial [candidate division Zixibacteria bacterium]|nr:phosphomannomutase/phosphoglucomutase [candidate division Zixibacteria bacterium]
VRSGEFNSRVADQKAKIEAIAEAYGDGRQDRIDGLTVAYDTFWFNLRPSNTEPLLRLNIEADSPRILEVQKAKLLGLIRS